jgi:acetyl esterase/lipase
MSLQQGTFMNVTRAVALSLLPALLAAPARADELKIAPGALGKYEVEAVKDVAYNGATDADPAKHKLDLYLPRGQKDFPVLFFVHGGTWQRGDRKRYAPFGELYASHGIGTVVISYRLSPQVKHPAHVEDVAKAFAWTCRNVGKHGGRADQVICCGHSAGGHLVALLATDETYLKAEKCSAADVRAVIPISGVYTIPPIGLAKVFGTDARVIEKASPSSHVTGKHPPFLFIYGDRDLPLLGLMADNMCASLKKAECEAATLEVKKRDHVGIMTKMIEEDDPARKAILEFVAKQTAKP